MFTGCEVGMARTAHAAKASPELRRGQESNLRFRTCGDTTLHPLRERIYRAIGVPTVR